MLTRTRDEWLALIPKEISVVAMLEFDEVLEGEYAKERGMVLELNHPLEGTVRQLSSPFRLSETPPTFRHFAPVLGEHTVKSSMALAVATARLANLSRRALSAPVTGACHCETLAACRTKQGPSTVSMVEIGALVLDFF